MLRVFLALLVISRHRPAFSHHWLVLGHSILVLGSSKLHVLVEDYHVSATNMSKCLRVDRVQRLILGFKSDEH